MPEECHYHGGSPFRGFFTRHGDGHRSVPEKFQPGKSAVYQSKARAEVPILAFTPNYLTYRTLNLYWGVTPFLAPFSNTIKDMLAYMEQILIREYGFVQGQKVVFTSGFPIGKMRATNLALLHVIGELED